MRKTFYILFLAWLALPLSAEPNRLNWIVRPFHSQDGLPYEVVRDISWFGGNPDVWIATWSGGVARYDGIHWKTLSPQTGFPFDSIRTVTPVGRDRAWIGADIGFAYVDQDRVVDFNQQKHPTLPDSNCFSSLQVSEEEVWIGTNAGYILAVSATIPSGASTTWRVILGPEVTHGSQVREIIKDRTGRIWVANSRNGVLCYENNTWHLIGTRFDLEGDCLCVCEAPDGSIWATGSSSLMRYDGKGWERLQTFQPSLNAVAFTPHGVPLVGSSKGLFIYQDQEWQEISLEQDTPEQFVETIACQEDEVVWVGTRVGVFRLSHAPWSPCVQTENHTQLIAESLVAVPDHPPLTLSENNELMRYDGNLWRPIVSLPFLEITNGFITNPLEGKVWILSGSDVTHCTIDPPSLLQRIPVPDRVEPRSLYQETNGTLWLLSTKGLFRLNDTSWLQEPSGQSGYIHEKVLCFSRLKNGDYWVGYENRVERWRNGEITTYPARGNLFIGWPPICAIDEVRDGRTFFGTSSYGLMVLDARNTWNRITEKEGLFRNRIFSLYQDTRDILWVGHRDIGLSFQYKNLWIPHKYQEGLPIGTIERIGEYPSGKMWVSMTSNRIYTYTLSKDPPETTLFVKDLELNQKESGFVSFQGKDLWNQTLSRDLYYSHRIIPENQRLSDRNWSPFTQENQVRLPLLQPGRYLIQVRSLDKDGNLDPTPATTTLTVNPPIWQRGEFFFPVVLLSLVSLVAFAAFFRKHLALTDSEERYRNLVDDALTVILKWDSRERITYWNEYAEHLLGFTSEEAVGSPVLEILFSNTESGRNSLEEIRQNLMSSKGQAVHRRSQHQSREGQQLLLSWTYRAVLTDEGRLEEVHAFGSDCTEQVKAENALSESEQKYRNLVERASDSILILQDGVIKYANPQLAALLGIPLDELLNQSFLKHIDEKDKEKVLSNYNRRLAGESVPEAYEITLRDSMNRPISIEIHAVVVPYEGRSASLVLLRDITRRKQAQEALLKSSRMEATATLAGGIAHDFNNLMVGILGYSELLRMEFQDRPDITRMLDRVIRSAERAGELSQQMLSYARGGKYRPQNIDLNHVVTETIRQRAKSFPDGVRLESNLQPDLPRILADPVQISEVVLGLLSNAVEALPGNGLVTIETTSQDVSGIQSNEMSLRNGRHLILTVADNGCGMDHEILSRIFEPFFTTKFQGRGLGLAAVYGIVKNHGGDISVCSEKGHGTIFKVFLPLGNN